MQKGAHYHSKSITHTNERSAIVLIVVYSPNIHLTFNWQQYSGDKAPKIYQCDMGRYTDMHTWGVTISAACYNRVTPILICSCNAVATSHDTNVHLPPLVCQFTLITGRSSIWLIDTFTSSMYTIEKQCIRKDHILYTCTEIQQLHSPRGGRKNGWDNSDCPHLVTVATDTE